MGDLVFVSSKIIQEGWEAYVAELERLRAAFNFASGRPPNWSEAHDKRLETVLNGGTVL